MKTRSEIQQIAIKTIDIEKEAIEGLKTRINADFIDAVEALAGCTGRVVITGIGKSASIAKKMVATLNSTGTSAIFMHAADAIHGDLGIINNEDIIICLSKSGNTPEIKVLVPLLKSLGGLLIALVGDINSYLAKQADLVIDTYVPQEACPNNLAPTSSTTAQLVMGDALAVCLLECKGFTVDDFARYHPGGALGKKLYLKVGDLCSKNQVPQVDKNTDLKSLIFEISSKRLGMSAVIENNQLIGVITDGDIRRMLEKHTDISMLRANDIMTHHPKTVDINTLAIKALDIMRTNNITQLIVMDKDSYKGVIHLHDIINEGII